MGIAGGGKEPIEIGLRALPYRDGDEFGDIVGVEFAQAQFDRGKKLCARLDEHQGFGGGFDRAVPSIDRMDIVNDIDAGCELLGDESGRDAMGFLWRTGRRKGYDEVGVGVLSHNLTPGKDKSFRVDSSLRQNDKKERS